MAVISLVQAVSIAMFIVQMVNMVRIVPLWQRREVQSACAAKEKQNLQDTFR